VEDLWLSAMCALGDGEGKLARLAVERDGREFDDDGLACDDF